MTALLDYLDARLLFSLPHTLRDFVMGPPRGGTWPRLSTKPLTELRRMTTELRAGKGDYWDDIAAAAEGGDLPIDRPDESS
jgi:hypothetical protein